MALQLCSKRYEFNPHVMIPEVRIDDVIELREYIQERLHIEISLLETFIFWVHVSRSLEVPWLEIEAFPYNMTREEFIEKELRKYGAVINMS